MYKSFILSLLFHFFIIIFLFVILPKFFTKKNNIEIAVDIISVEQVKPILNPKDIINQKNTDKIREPIPDNKISDDKIPAPFENKEESKKKEISKKKLKKMEKQIKKTVDQLKSDIGKAVEDGSDQKSQDIGDILKEVKRIQGEEKERFNRERFLYGDNLTALEEANIRKQVNFCWSNIINKIFLKEDLSDIEVRVKVSFDSEGFVKNVDFSEDMHKYMEIDNDLYRKLADSVRSTFLRCKKIEAMPKSKYSKWKQLEFVFRPEAIN